jgi:hypothetical protein
MRQAFELWVPFVVCTGRSAAFTRPRCAHGSKYSGSGSGSVGTPIVHAACQYRYYIRPRWATRFGSACAVRPRLGGERPQRPRPDAQARPKIPFISQPPRLITCPTEAHHLSDRGSHALQRRQPVGDPIAAHALRPRLVKHRGSSPVRPRLVTCPTEAHTLGGKCRKRKAVDDCPSAE